jgi:hypothetical protein
MGYGCGQFNVTHPLSANLGLNDLDSALFTNHTPVFHPLIFAAVTFIILSRAEDLGAKKPIPLRLKGSVVYGFRLFDLSVGPLSDFLGRCQRDTNRRVAQWVLWSGKETV